MRLCPRDPHRKRNPTTLSKMALDATTKITPASLGMAQFNGSFFMQIEQRVFEIDGTLLGKSFVAINNSVITQRQLVVTTANDASSANVTTSTIARDCSVNGGTVVTTINDTCMASSFADCEIAPDFLFAGIVSAALLNETAPASYNVTLGTSCPDASTVSCDILYLFTAEPTTTMRYVVRSASGIPVMLDVVDSDDGQLFAVANVVDFEAADDAVAFKNKC